jgi:alpha-L-rhamnosidase
VSSAWTIKNGTLELAIEVPHNTRATVRLPGAQLADVRDAGQALSIGNGIAAARQDGSAVVVDVGSGQYRFAYALLTSSPP